MLNDILHKEHVHRALSRAHIIIDCGFTLSVQERQGQEDTTVHCKSFELETFCGMQKFNCNSLENSWLAVSLV